jgi:hypothetical protein
MTLRKGSCKYQVDVLNISCSLLSALSFSEQVTKPLQSLCIVFNG